MTPVAQPTPTPYTVNGFGGDFHVIARMQPHEVAISAKGVRGGEIETASFIVLACNSFDALTAEAADLRSQVNRDTEVFRGLQDALYQTMNERDALTEANKKLREALEYIRDLGADGADKKYMRAQSKAERVLDAIKVQP